MRGYVGMIVVKKAFRRLKLGRKLALMFIDKCKELGADEVCLETESTNIAALKLYESLGFAKVKKLMNYYLNGSDAFRLKLFFTDRVGLADLIYRKQQQEKKDSQILAEAAEAAAVVAAQEEAQSAQEETQNVKEETQSAQEEDNRKSIEQLSTETVFAGSGTPANHSSV